MSVGIVQSQADLDLAKEALRAVLRDGAAPAAARAAAARTMLELNGALGRNAAPPIDVGKPTSELSRAELEAELATLAGD